MDWGEMDTAQFTLSTEDFDKVLTTMFGEMSVGTVLTMLLIKLAHHTGHITYIRGLQRGLDK